MHSTRHDWSALQANLQRDLATSRQLLLVIGDERKALEARDYAAFEAAIAPKQTLLAQLENGFAERRQWLSQHRIAAESVALRLAETEAPAVAELWRETAASWRQCQTETQINEQISRRTRAVVQQVLDVLRGQHQQSAVYDAKGNSQHESRGRTISNA